MQLLKVKILLSSLLLGAALFFGAPLSAEPVELALKSEMSSLSEGSSFWVALDLTMEEGWHAYWKNPGDAGMAPQIEWTLPDGFVVERVEWPYPALFTVGPMEAYGYSDKAILLAKITVPKNSPFTKGSLKVDLRWVVCNDETCLPGSSEASLPLLLTDKISEANPAEKSYFETARSKIPTPLIPLEVKNEKGVTKGVVKIEGLKPDQHQNAQFFPEEGKTDASLTPHPTESDHYFLTLGEGPSKGVLVAGDKAFEMDLSQASSEIALSDEAEGKSLQDGLADSDVLDSVLLAMGLAFLGGIILNLMPCVLPVVALKVLDFVNLAGKDRWHTLKHGLIFSLGVLVSFWVLAIVLLLLQTLGQSVGWGFQLQEPIFVAALALLMVVFSLSLFGVFEMGTLFASWAGQKEARSQSASSASSGSSFSAFFSGVLATAVATPCTGPFLGSAIGFAVTLPPAGSLAIFTALGLGMALPYLLLTAFPQLLRFVPRPGKWMETFRQAMGFMMLLAALWLAWVFSSQTTDPALILLLLAFFAAGLACWILGKWATPFASRASRLVSWGLVLLLAFFTFQVVSLASSLEHRPEQGQSRSEIAESDWEPFSSQRLEALRKAGTPVFIDFTAKWCLTCQVNHVSLTTSQVEAKMKEKGIVKMKADWTQKDPEITAELKKWGRSSVPLYILYGGETPKILPQTLTPNNVIQSLDELNDDN